MLGIKDLQFLQSWNGIQKASKAKHKSVKTRMVLVLSLIITLFPPIEFSSLFLNFPFLPYFSYVHARALGHIYRNTILGFLNLNLGLKKKNECRLFYKRSQPCIPCFLHGPYYHCYLTSRGGSNWCFSTRVIAVPPPEYPSVASFLCGSWWCPCSQHIVCLMGAQ